MTELQELKLYNCKGIAELPGVEDLVDLRKFHLAYCGDSGPFPNFKKLFNLDTLIC